MFLGFALINVGVIAYIAVKEFAGGENKAESVPVSQINFFFILAGIGCFALCILMETFKYEAMIRASAGKSDKEPPLRWRCWGNITTISPPSAPEVSPFRYFI